MKHNAALQQILGEHEETMLMLFSPSSTSNTVFTPLFVFSGDKVSFTCKNKAAFQWMCVCLTVALYSRDSHSACTILLNYQHFTFLKALLVWTMNNYNPSIYRVICIVTLWFFERKKMLNSWVLMTLVVLELELMAFLVKWLVLHFAISFPLSGLCGFIKAAGYGCSLLKWSVI